ncbi:MAG TPA: hypothetical protein VN176_14090 [Verrucomicrobiae bacterium]|jgi:hypothetical protein|nr:hypothetical protein [Verrucomicrobiae bacterium]
MTTPWLLVFLISLAFPAPTVNGVKIVTRQVAVGGFADIRTEYVTADRLRSEWQVTPERMGPIYPMASIVQEGDRERVFVLDLQAKEFVSYETDSRGTPLGAKSKQVSDSGGVLQIWIDHVDTGERKEILGYVARHIITREKRIASPKACSGSSESQTDGWYVDTSIMPEWRQPKKRLGGIVVASMVSADSAANCVDRVDKIEVHRAGMEPGFPVRVSTSLQSEIKDHDRARTIASSWGSEVVELQSGPIDAALFEVPPDFRQVDKLRSFFGTPPRRQVSGWDWLKERVQEIFK